VSNPLVGAYKTEDGRWLMLCMLQPGRYWPEFCRTAGRPELAADERFDCAEKLMANAADAADIVAEIMASRPYDAWVEALSAGEGQWAPVQGPWDIANDAALRANDMIAKVTDAEGIERELVASPVQFDERGAELARAPQFAEHTDEIIRELGRTDEQLMKLKIAGAVT
jgi:crotonobetainyl-CoA:carnitine CoA-transferase CaiB-like acyl-CoA transferase